MSISFNIIDMKAINSTSKYKITVTRGLNRLEPVFSITVDGTGKIYYYYYLTKESVVKTE